MLKRLLPLFLMLVPAFAQQHSNTLSWNWSQGTGDPATGFHVQKSSTSGGPYSIIATITGTVTMTYVDTNVTSGQTNFYVVTAFNGGGESVPSNQVACTTPFSGPGAPTGLSGVIK